MILFGVGTLLMVIGLKLSSIECLVFAILFFGAGSYTWGLSDGYDKCLAEQKVKNHENEK